MNSVSIASAPARKSQLPDPIGTQAELSQFSGSGPRAQEALAGGAREEGIRIESARIREIAAALPADAARSFLRNAVASLPEQDLLKLQDALNDSQRRVAEIADLAAATQRGQGGAPHDVAQSVASDAATTAALVGMARSSTDLETLITKLLDSELKAREMAKLTGAEGVMEIKREAASSAFEAAMNDYYMKLFLSEGER